MSYPPGFELVTELQSNDYQWYAIGVWREIATGRLFWATDSGCSCYGPWEDIKTGADLDPLDYGALSRDVPNVYETTPSERIEFLKEVAEAMREQEAASV